MCVFCKKKPRREIGRIEVADPADANVSLQRDRARSMIDISRWGWSKKDPCIIKREEKG